MTRRADLPILGAILVGGGAGSVLRYALTRAVRPTGDGFPTATLMTNLVGSLLLGALIVAVTEIWRPHRLVRPLLGTGLLGGFTTFSTFAVEARGASATVATTYVAGSVVGGVFAAAIGMLLIRRLEPRLRLASTHEAVDPIDPDLP
jgi:CrcB protein